MQEKTRRFLIMGLFSLLLEGCHTFKPKAYESPEVTLMPCVTPVSETDLDMGNMTKVRTPESIKGYPIGRYHDPNHPEVMHEGHVIYRQEAPSSWNRNPNAPTAVPLGPTVAISHPERHREPLEVEYETKIVQQNQLMKSLIDQNEALIDLVNELKGEINTTKTRKEKTDGL